MPDDFQIVGAGIQYLLSSLNYNNKIQCLFFIINNTTDAYKFNSCDESSIELDKSEQPICEATSSYKTVELAKD
jgi:hypothetical protein